MGVLRGDPVDHPKYRGRRIFSSGINLTKIYHGKVSFLFYLVRDLGLVNKLYRGLALEDQSATLPETTLEKPWMAVVDAFAIGGGCQLLLVVDYVLAEAGAYFNLPARKEGIIPGAANLRLPRFLGERLAREAILFDRKFPVDEPEAKALVNEVHPREKLDGALERAVANAVGSGMVSASGNRKAIRVQTEPIDAFRRYMATYAREQAYCHLSEQLVANLEKHWDAKSRSL
jgi:thioesterase DpgC